MRVKEQAKVDLGEESSGRQRGFSLIELAAALTIMTVVSGGAWNIVYRSQVFFQEQTQLFGIAENGARIMERLTEELRKADPLSLVPIVLENSTSVQFQQVIGFEDGKVQLGPVQTIGFVLAKGESLNGVDDNGDGRPDEGRVTFNDGNGNVTDLAQNVLGLQFNSTGNRVTFSSEVGVVTRDGVLRRQTFTREIVFRN